LRLPAFHLRHAWIALALLLAVLLGIGFRLPAASGVTPAELDAIAATAGREVEALLERRLAAVVETGRAWEARTWEEGGLEPGSAAAGDWLEAARRRMPGTLWLGITDGRGIIRADSGNRLLGADVGKRDWFLRGREAPGVLPAHEAILLRPLFLAKGREPDRMFDYVAPVRGPDGTVRGVLGVHVPERAMAEALHAALPAQDKPVRLVIADPSGSVVLGAGQLTPGLEQRSRPAALSIGGAAAALGWTLYAETLPGARSASGLPIWLLGIAALALAVVAAALAAHVRRSLLAAGPGWGGRLLRLRRAPRSAMLAMAVALVLLGGVEWRVEQRSRRSMPMPGWSRRAWPRRWRSGTGSGCPTSAACTSWRHW
jgi:hypothetical protein